MARRQNPSHDPSPKLDQQPSQAQLGLPVPAPQPSPDPQIDRIRDILFGPQMHTYEQQFAMLREEVAELHKEISALAAKLGEQAEIDARALENAKRGLRVSIDHLRADVDRLSERLTSDKVDRATLGELFVELGSRLKDEGGA